MCIKGATVGAGLKEQQGSVSNGKSIEEKANKARQQV